MSRKTVFKVAELAHVYMNGKAPDGARAGEYAGVVHGGRMLAHDRGSESRPPLPAAVFLADATAPDGRRAVVIAAAGCPDARYSLAELSAAVPSADVLAVMLPSWPESDALDAAPESVCAVGRNARYPARDYHRAGAAMAAGVDVLTRVYIASVAPAARRSILSATDTAGDTTAAAVVQRHVSAAAALLSLAWADPAAQERARAALRAVCEHWHIDAAGSSADIAILRAVAQRDAIAAQARAQAPRLRMYFDARAAVRGPAARLALVETHRADTLGNAIAAVLRAGMAFGSVGLESVPADAAAVIAADCASVGRVRNMRAALSTIYGGRPLSWSAAGLPRGLVAESQRRKAQADAITGRAHRVDEAGRDSRDIAAAPSVVARAAAAAAALDALPWQSADAYEVRDALASLPDIVTDREHGDHIRGPIMHAGSLRRLADLAGRVRPTMQAVCGRAEARATRRGTRPLPARMADRIGAWRAISAPLDDGAIITTLRAAADRWDRTGRALACAENAKTNISAAEAHLAAGRPRAALEAVGRVSGGWETRAAFRVGAANSVVVDAFGRDGAAIVAAVRALEAEASAAAGAIDEMAEWRNGGAAPRTGGDHMRLSADGRRVVTSRGAEVATSAVRRALAWLDAQPDGPVSCRFEIGHYVLTGRDADGCVTVGCHRFGRDAVQYIRDAIASRADAMVEVTP